MSYLKDQRYGSEAVPAKKKKTRLHAEPGKSVATVYSEGSEQETIDDDKDEEVQSINLDVEKAGPSN